MRQAINRFFASDAYAVVGASPDPKKFGHRTLRMMKEKGLRVFPVNPRHYTIDGMKCYPSIFELPPEVRSVVTVVPPEQTEKVVHDCVMKGIETVWMQRGSESHKAIREAQKGGITVVHGYCILMFLEPVQGAHSFHRFFTKLVGAYPR